ncbi:MAG: DUF2085 domain-containing protein [Methanofollis sp.]|uniref:DUF2085 domain-containing protein n=1 Tax=Methanofollis sp. TaxID=2052835 RepID=UPI00261F9BF9|nr:DUF2085 domain-containing protein [Methanofollis sp.]MDD4255306.1 DUF2085 domain-containing protein [Methanofollis sp.]
MKLSSVLSFRNIISAFFLIFLTFLVLQFIAPILIGANTFQNEMIFIQSNGLGIKSIPASIASNIYTIGGVFCHQKPSRSFKIWGNYLPLCARCLGILIGMTVIFGYSLVVQSHGKFFEALNIFLPRSFRKLQYSWILISLIGIGLILPMVFDGFVQLLTVYESTNIKRVITGLLFGAAEGGFVVGMVSHLCFSMKMRL